MLVMKNIVFIVMAGMLSSTVLAKPTDPVSPYKPKSLARLFSPQAKLAEETTLTAAALAQTGDKELVDSMVPEGAKLVDGTQQNEFYIVPKDGAMPKVETAQTVAVTKAMDEAAEMVNKIDGPKLQTALGEKVHAEGTPPESVKAMKNKLGPNVKMVAENAVKKPIQLVEASPVTTDVAPSTESTPAEQPSTTTETPSTTTETPSTTTETPSSDTTTTTTTTTESTATPEPATPPKEKKAHHNSKAKHHGAKAKVKTKAKPHHAKTKVKVKTKTTTTTKVKTISSKHLHAKPMKHSKHKPKSTNTKHHVVYHGKTYKVKRFEELH